MTTPASSSLFRTNQIQRMVTQFRNVIFNFKVVFETTRGRKTLETYASPELTVCDKHDCQLKSVYLVSIIPYTVELQWFEQ